MKLKMAYLLVFYLFVSVEAFAQQKLWQNTSVGMSPAEVVAAVDGARRIAPAQAEPISAEVRADGAEGLSERVRAEGYRTLGETFTAQFYFLDESLQRVLLTLDEEKDYYDTVDMVNTLLFVLEAEHGPYDQQRIDGQPVAAGTDAGRRQRIEFLWYRDGLELALLARPKGRRPGSVVIEYMTSTGADEPVAGGR